MNKELSIEFSFSPSDMVYCRLYSILSDFKEENLKELQRVGIEPLDLPDFIAVTITDCIYEKSLITGRRSIYYRCAYAYNSDKVIYLYISEDYLIEECNIDLAVEIFNHDQNEGLNFVLDSFCFNKLRNNIPVHKYEVSISILTQFDFNINSAFLVNSSNDIIWSIPRKFSSKVTNITVIYQGIGRPTIKIHKSIYREQGYNIPISKIEYE